MFLLLFGAATIYAQESTMADANVAVLQTLQHPDKLLAVKDFKLTDGRMIVTEIPCRINSGDNSCQFLVSVVCQQKAFRELGLEKINQIIVMANQKAQATLHRESVYMPAEIRLSYNPIIKDWSLTNLFSTTDMHGKVNSKLLSMDFDSAGEFKVMKSVF